MTSLRISKNIDDEEFRTHLNYAKCVRDLTNGLTITCTSKLSGKLDSSKLTKFTNLANLTAKNLLAEISACKSEIDYSQIVAPWLPVKCYYRLYYLESMSLYLVSGSEVGFKQGGHKAARRGMRSLVENGSLVVSSPKFSKISTVMDSKKHKTDSGKNIGARYYTTDDCVSSVRKKVGDYIETDWKERESINYKRPDDRKKRDHFKSTEKFSLMDYFYWMRMKANYKDISFLDFSSRFDSSEAYTYAMAFYDAMNNYASAIIKLNSSIVMSRNMLPAKTGPGIRTP